MSGAIDQGEALAALAAKLTKAQREVLTLHTPFYGSKTQGWPGSAIRDEQSFAQAGRAMMILGLVRWERDPRSSRTEITPLGLALREHIQTNMEGER